MALQHNYNTVTPAFLADLNANFSAAAFVTGALTPGNLPILTANGIQDSGTTPINSSPSGTVWGNNTSGAATPAFITILNLANGTAALPTYSFIADVSTGIYRPGPNSFGISVGGHEALEIETPTGTDSIKILASSTATVQSTGGANAPLQLSSNGVGSLDIMSAGGGAYTTRFLTTNSAANYLQVNAVQSGNNVRLSTNAANLLFGTGSAIATSATDGYIMIQSCAGAPTGVPTGNAAGAIAMQYDTSNNKIWFYNGAWRGVVVT